MLSRVRSLATLRSLGLAGSIRNIIEGVPREPVINTFELLFRIKIDEASAVAEAAAKELGWI